MMAVTAELKQTVIEAARDNHSSSSHPDVPNQAGKTNWVEKAGGLPPYIRRIARHLMADAGMSTSQAIATAVNTVKRWARGGGDVTAATQAKAAKALAEWNAKKAAGRGLSRAEMIEAIELAWKYDPNQPRWPKGSGDKSGQWLDTGAGDGNGAAPVVSSAAPAKKKPIKKNSVEYWERALELTKQAQAKQTPGGKVWQKMNARRAEQTKMIEHMKATGKPTLTEDEWTQIKSASDTPVLAVPSSSETKMSGPEWVEKTTELLIHPSFVYDLMDNAESNGNDAYLFRADDGALSMSSSKPAPGTAYLKATQSGDIFFSENESSSASPAASAEPGAAAASTPGNGETKVWDELAAAQNMGVDVAFVKDLKGGASAHGKDTYLYVGDNDVVTLSYDKPSFGVPYMKATPDGEVFYNRKHGLAEQPPKKTPAALDNTASPASSSSDPGEVKVWGGGDVEIAMMGHIGIETSELVALKDTAASIDQDGYLFKDPYNNGAVKHSSFKPNPGTPYVKVKPNGDVFYNDGKSSPGPTSSAAPVVSSSPSTPPMSLDQQISAAANGDPAGINEIEEALGLAKSEGVFYVVGKSKSSGEWAAIPGWTPATPGTKYVKVTPEGEITVHEVPSPAVDPPNSVPTAVPTVSSATVPGASSTPSGLKTNVPVAIDKPAGPDTPFKFKDENTRSFGLGVLKTDDQVHFEGTPEGNALSGRFIPQDDEVARHYRDSSPDVPANAKSTVRSYTGSGYTGINNPLRIPGEIAESAAGKIQRMDKAMDKYATAEPMILSRGLGSQHFPTENLVGKMVQDSAFMSTAVGGSGGFGGKVRMHLLAPAGTHGVSVNGLFEDGGNHPHEREFILPRGTTIMVSKDKTINGTRHITGTIVPIPKSAVAGKSGVVATPSGVDPKGYSKEGLEFLRTQGRKKWAARYANGNELSLSREARTWYNRLVRERSFEVVTTGSIE